MVNSHISMEHHHFSWVNQLLLWPFAVADCGCWPEGPEGINQMMYQGLSLWFPSTYWDWFYWNGPVDLCRFTHDWLVVWNIFYFPKKLGMSSSQLTKIFFQRGRAQPPTRWKNRWISIVMCQRFSEVLHDFKATETDQRLSPQEATPGFPGFPVPDMAPHGTLTWSGAERTGASWALREKKEDVDHWEFIHMID